MSKYSDVKIVTVWNNARTGKPFLGESVEKELFWLREDGTVSHASSSSREDAQRYVKNGEMSPPVSKFPRFFTGSFFVEETAYAKFTGPSSKEMIRCNHDGSVETNTGHTLEYILGRKNVQEITEKEALALVKKPEPQFPRYFKAKPGIMGGGYRKVNAATGEGNVEYYRPDGSLQGVYNTNLSFYLRDRDFTEITAEQFQAETQPKKPEPVIPVVRYFVPTYTTTIDHVRWTDDVCAAVYKDGKEEKWTFPMSDFTRSSCYKEVFPTSSDSLRRSHRYAAKWNEGKEAGKAEANSTIAALQKRINELVEERSQLKRELVSTANYVERHSFDRVVNENNRLKNENAAIHKAKEDAQSSCLRWQQAYNRVKDVFEAAANSSRLNVRSL